MSRLFYIWIIGIAVLISSCSKDPEINKVLNSNARLVQPIKYIEEHSNKIDTLVNFYGGVHELGLRFRSDQAGIIHEVGLKTPNSGKFTVTIWDMESQEILRTILVNTVSDQFIYQTIPSLAIDANKEYVISFNTFHAGEGQRFYQARKKSGERLYPFSAYGIHFLDFRYRSGSETKFPIGVGDLEQDLIPGLLDFKIEFSSIVNE